MNLSQAYQDFARACNGRILVMDGNFGSQLMLQMPKEKDFRGKMFANHPVDLSGNEAVLCVTAPDRVKKVHRAYLEAGADIIRTNTSNANAFGQKPFQLEDMAYDIAKAGAAVACEEFFQRNRGGCGIAVRESLGRSSSASLSPVAWGL